FRYRCKTTRLFSWCTDFRVAHASRVLAMTSRHRRLFRKIFRRDAESPSRTGLTRNTRVLPRLGHSVRNASTGLTRVARYAGKKHASNAASPRIVRVALSKSGL